LEHLKSSIMRILSYQQLLTLPPVLSYKRDKLVPAPEINLSAWNNELVAVIGGQLASQAFLKKVLQAAKPGASPEPGEAAGLAPESSLYEHLCQVIARRTPKLSEESISSLTEQYLAAAYLQPYRSSLAEEVGPLAWKQLLLALTFALEQPVMILPDIFTGAANTEKALLRRVIHNLRHLQLKPRTIFFLARQPEEALFLADRVVVLEPGASGTIGEVIPVFFQEPRNRSIISQLPAYRALRKRLRYLLTDACAGEDLLSFSTLQSIS